MKKRWDAWVAGEKEMAPITGLMGMKPVTLEPGLVVLSMVIDERFHNPMGILHGGVYGDLADAAMGMALASTLDPDESFATLEIATKFFIPITNTTLTARAHLIRRGGRTAYIECDLLDDRERLVAKSTSTILISKN